MYSIAWYQQNHILSIHLIGTVNLVEIQEIEATIGSYLDEQYHPLHVIIDLNSVTHLPVSLYQLQKTVSNLEHPQHGQLILFGGSHLAGLMAGWLSRLYTSKVHYASDLMHALNILQDCHPELDTHTALNYPV